MAKAKEDGLLQLIILQGKVLVFNFRKFYADYRDHASLFRYYF